MFSLIRSSAEGPLQAVEDKTFGLKNKKGAKGQKFVQQVQQSIDATAAKKSGCACHSLHIAPSLLAP